MRMLSLTATVPASLAAICLSALIVGCTASSGIEGLELSAVPSVDPATTGSVRPIVPLAGIPAGNIAGNVRPTDPQLGFAGQARISPAAKALLKAKGADQETKSKRPRIYEASFSDAEPIDFGRLTPDAFAVHGVDVSRWQGEIDWPKLRREGANFAFIKATDGGDHLDPNFHENWKEAAKAGVARGAYHFFYWCRTASSQADWFIRNVPKSKGALPPVLDVEWNHASSCKKRPPREVVLEKMRVFLNKLEAHYGQRPIIYTSPDFYEENLKGAFPKHPFWLRSVAVHPSKVYPERDFVFWQYSGTGLADSHDTKIDLNVFNGTKKGWQQWLKSQTL